MPVQSLLRQAACKIPFEWLSFVYPSEKRVINREMSRFVRRTRLTRGLQSLGSLCNCKSKLTEELAQKWEDGECLCYYSLIRNDQMEQFWATENDYEYLGDWYITDWYRFA